MFILLTNIAGEDVVIKKTSIQFIYSTNGKTRISCAGKHKLIVVSETVKEFYDKYLA